MKIHIFDYFGSFDSDVDLKSTPNDMKQTTYIMCKWVTCFHRCHMSKITQDTDGIIQ